MRVYLYPSKIEYARMFLDFAPLKLNMRVCLYPSKTEYARMFIPL